MPGRLVSPRIIGREPEVAAIALALDRAMRGEPEHLLLAGEAGVGKSRLVAEAGRMAADRGVRVLAGGCADIGDGGVPYGPIVEILRSLVRGRTEDEVDAIIGAARSDLARLVPSLGAAPEAASPTEFVQPRLLDAILGVLLRLADESPILVVIEDLHWADPATRDAVAFLVRHLRAERVLLLMTFRSDELHRRHPLLQWLAELERGGRVARMAVPRLDAARTGELLASILGESQPEDVVERVHARSDGNPFFVEELIGSGPAATGPIPPTLRDVLVARIAALPDAGQAVVRVAAVAGRRVDHELLALVADMPDEALLDGLRAAVGSQVLVTGPGDAGAEDGDYGFRHALLQEAAYDDLLPGERLRLHRACAEALAARGPGAGAMAAGHWGELAWHWFAARDDERAFEASVRAGDAATKAFAFADARRHDERALELWPSIADPEAVAGIDRAALLERAAQAAWLSADSRRCVALRREAVEELEGRGDPVRLGVAMERLGRGLWYHGDTIEALEAHEAAVALIPPEPPSPQLARVLAGYGQILMLLDRWGPAQEVLERAVAMARAVSARQAEGHALSSLGLVLSASGRVREGYAALEAALVIAHEVQSPDDIGRAYVNLSDARRYGGDPEGALEVVRRGVIAAHDLGLERTYAYFIRSNGIQAAYELDAWDEAAELAAHSVEGPAEGRVHRRYGLANWLPLLVARGDPEVEARLKELEMLLDGVAVEGQFHRPLRIAQAEHAAWNGAPGDALVAIRTGREELGELGERWYDVRLLRIGVHAAAEAAEVARARRDARGEAEAIRDGTGWWTALEALARRARGAWHGLALDEIEAEETLAAAERRRLDGVADPTAWRTSRDRWVARKNVYLAAYTGFREAEALLQGGARAEATAALREAHEVAAHLGAAPLRREIERLAARARLDLEAAPAAEPEARVALPRDPFGLTPRERDVLPLLVQGRTNRQIAEALFISENTAGVHVSNILGKLGASTRTEAAAIATRLGLDEA